MKIVGSPNITLPCLLHDLSEMKRSLERNDEFLGSTKVPTALTYHSRDRLAVQSLA